jgi:serine protease AprX
VTYINNQANLRTGNGTSFSGPLVAGMVACLKQAWPDVTNQQIFDAVIQSADRYNNPDTAYGYGIPDVIKADSLLNIFSKVDPVEPADAVSIYPNPAKTTVTLSAQNPIDFVRITTLNGQRIMSLPGNHQLQVSIDIADITPGLFIVEIYGNGSKTLKRLLVH